jgi:hypothetical protein
MENYFVTRVSTNIDPVCSRVHNGLQVECMCLGGVGTYRKIN